MLQPRALGLLNPVDPYVPRLTYMLSSEARERSFGLTLAHATFLRSCEITCEALPKRTRAR